MRKSFTYDDISLIPQYSEIESRRDVDLTTQLSRRYKLKIPIVASPMDTVCESEMAIAMMELGGVGCIHRFMTIEEQSKQINIVLSSSIICNDTPIMAAIGANGDYLERAQELVKNNVNVLLIDVAHGHHIYVKNAIDNLKKNIPEHVDIIAGNIATYEAAKDLVNWGADGIRVGIGGGSLCTSRIKTGFGVPNVTSIEDCVSGIESTGIDIPIIADGGIRSSGDIAKALAIGANTVMLGSLLSGTQESPGAIIEKSNGLYKRYRGSASLETKSAHGQDVRNVEGESTVVPFKGGVKFIISGLLDGIRSALSYAGSISLKEFHPNYVVVTHAGSVEASPHMLR